VTFVRRQRNDHDVVLSVLPEPGDYHRLGQGGLTGRARCLRGAVWFG
jgi:hypothetical protein